jgi:hypothetical protein
MIVTGAWLDEINRINGRIREAQTKIRLEHEASDVRQAELAELSAAAEESRATAAAAREACEAARQGLDQRDDDSDEIAVVTDYEPAGIAQMPSVPRSGSASEALATAFAPTLTVAPQPASSVGSAESAESAASVVGTLAPVMQATAEETAREQIVDPESPDPVAIVRLLRRERATLSTLVDGLAGADPAARACWQFLLSNLVDAATAVAIEQGYLEFPPGNMFWDALRPEEARAVAMALASLGFRPDGLGEFADGRVPVPRDLALAVGAAGLLPARVKYWPGSGEAAELFCGVRVAADSMVAQRSPALDLDEIVSLLGWRSRPLADLWSDWPRVRPLFLAMSGD